METGSKKLRQLDRAVNRAERRLELINPLIREANFGPNQQLNPSVTPIGNSGWYWNGTTPLNPNNCAEWANSPQCTGQSPINPAAFRTLLDANVSISLGRCESCATFNTYFLGVPGPPLTVCYRYENCREPEPEMNPPADNPDVKAPYNMPPVAPPNHYRVVGVYSELLVSNRMEYENFGLFGNPSPVSSEAWAGIQAAHPGTTQTKMPGQLHAIKTIFDTGRPQPNRFAREDRGQGWQILGNAAAQLPGASINSGGNFTWQSNLGEVIENSVTEYRIEAEQYYSFETRNFSAPGAHGKVKITTGGGYTSRVAWVDIPCADRNIREAREEGLSIVNAQLARSEDFEGVPENNRYFYGIQQGPGCYDDIQAPQPPPEDDMGCCEETLELLELIASKLGTEEFPVTTPALLIQEDEETLELENHAQLWEWLARNLDATIGQFPISIKIEDGDPTKKGNQEQELKIPNIAEGIAEIFGLAYQAEFKADLEIEMLLRLIPEVIAAKNAALIGQAYAKCNTSYLGFPVNLREQRYPSNFNVEQLNNLQGLLQETEVIIATPTDESKESQAQINEKLLFAAGIIKETFFVGGNGQGRLLDTIESMIEDEALAIPNKEEWREWLKRMNRETSRFNRDQASEPEIIEDLHERLDDVL
ncbi:MAG: hypothetical protein AAFR26_23910 [Cyanobacteria bacterium J06626_4]